MLSFLTKHSEIKKEKSSRKVGAHKEEGRKLKTLHPLSLLRIYLIIFSGTTRSARQSRNSLGRPVEFTCAAPRRRLPQPREFWLARKRPAPTEGGPPSQLSFGNYFRCISFSGQRRSKCAFHYLFMTSSGLFEYKIIAKFCSPSQDSQLFPRSFLARVFRESFYELERIFAASLLSFTFI